MISKDWEYNVLGVANYEAPGTLQHYFQFVKDNHDLIEGDIVESGVYQGKSLLGMALMLKALGSNKKVYGFDSFSGFPPIYHEKDNLNQFHELAKADLISSDHYNDVKKNLLWRNALSQSEATSANISSSGDFSLTSLKLLHEKIEILKLDNVVLVDGPFDKTMCDANAPSQIMCVLMDCDLYQSYLTTFNYVWPRLAERGLIYLDEYYSLKFPGARIATNEFVSQHRNAILNQFPSHKGDFERWGLFKSSM